MLADCLRAVPFVMADLEDGLQPRQLYNATPITAQFVTAMLKGKSGGTMAESGVKGESGGISRPAFEGGSGVKGGSGVFALKGGDATRPSGLETKYDGPRPHR